jgi:hypothetical protein
MYMLIKDLQRSAGDRYANKGLSGTDLAKIEIPAASHIFQNCPPTCLGTAFGAFPVYLHRQKLHYNALFVKIPPKHAL